MNGLTPAPLNLTSLLMLSPLWITGGWAVVLMLVLVFRRDHRLTFGLTLAGVALAFIVNLLIVHGTPLQITTLLVIDRFSLFYNALLLLTAFAVALLAYGYLERQDEQADEFYILLLMATFGCMTLAAATHFASFFLGLEILSVSLYAMITYLRTRERAVEAGIKYLILAGTSSAFLLFGMALVYAALGTMKMGDLMLPAIGILRIWLMAGVGLIIIGIGFKLAIVPFHMWTPDVYEGAPAPVTAFIATASKGAVFALVLRLFGQLGIHHYSSLVSLFALIAILSMFAGNLLALLQDNLKRILAYSSISHLGYMLVAFLTGSALGVQAVTIYLAAYFVTTLVAFGVVTVLSGTGRDRDNLEEYRGLFWRRPWLSGILAAALASLAGIPLTAGFIGKFYIVAAGARAGMWTLLILLVISSAIGLFYYLRVVVVMVDRGREGREAHPAPVFAGWSVTGGIALTALTVLLILWGVDPAPLIDWVRSAAEGMPF